MLIELGRLILIRIVVIRELMRRSKNKCRSQLIDLIEMHIRNNNGME